MRNKGFSQYVVVLLTLTLLALLGGAGNVPERAATFHLPQCTRPNGAGGAGSGAGGTGGTSSGGGCPSCHPTSTGSPVDSVDPFSGELSISDTPVSYKSIGDGFPFSMAYDGSSTRTTNMGPRWTYGFNAYIVNDARTEPTSWRKRSGSIILREPHPRVTLLHFRHRRSAHLEEDLQREHLDRLATHPAQPAI